MKNGFDTLGFSRNITATFQQYLRYNRKSRIQLLKEQADKLAFELQRQARAEGPRTIAEIQALPQTLGYHLKRRRASGLSKNVDVLKQNRRGKFIYNSLSAKTKRAALQGGYQHVTVAEEIALRLRWAGVYQASGWLSSKITLGLGRRRISNPRGRVIIHENNAKPMITMINQTPGAAEFAAKTGYVARAINERIRDMRVYIQRKMQEQAQAAFAANRPLKKAA